MEEKNENDNATKMKAHRILTCRIDSARPKREVLLAAFDEFGHEASLKIRVKQENGTKADRCERESDVCNDQSGWNFERKIKCH